METSRTLVVLRHAKSAWPDVPDHDRPLAERGRRDGPWAGRWLRETGHVPDHVLCSTALRARQTWQLAAESLGGPPVTYDLRLYAAEPAELLAIIAEEPGETATLLLVGHNPGVQELTLRLAGPAGGAPLERARRKFPTCAIAVLSVRGTWAGLTAGTATLTGFATPRQH